MSWVKNRFIISSDIDSDRQDTVNGKKILFDGTVVYKPTKGKKFPTEAKITHVFLPDNVLSMSLELVSYKYRTF